MVQGLATVSTIRKHASCRPRWTFLAAQVDEVQVLSDYVPNRPERGNDGKNNER